MEREWGKDNFGHYDQNKGLINHTSLETHKTCMSVQVLEGDRITEFNLASSLL